MSVRRKSSHIKTPNILGACARSVARRSAELAGDINFMSGHGIRAFMVKFQGSPYKKCQFFSSLGPILTKMLDHAMCKY